MSDAKFVNISRLITAYNLQIDNGVLPDDLKCVKCKLVMQDACVVPCGCRFCRYCIDDLMASGSEFCPGVSEDCGESLLSRFLTDYRANKSVCKLTVKCPQNGCFHMCQLDELEEHMRVCERKSVACPFHELGCQQDKLAVEKMSEHFQQENRSHFEILIVMIADINREMESHKREIEMLKRSDEDRKNENEMLKHELVLRDEKIKTILDQMEHVKNEIKSIKLENADLADRVRIEREFDERSASDERDMANVIEHVDKEITAITALIGSNKNELDTVVRSVRDDIRSINEESIKSIKNDIECTKSKIQSIQAPAGLDQIDASCELTINDDVGNMNWYIWDMSRTSEYFTGVAQPYKYRLASSNGINRGGLHIYLLIHPGASDAQLSWPFSGRVAITVADRSKREVCQTITKQCVIERPANNQDSSSAPFKFSHSSLIRAGLDLARGVDVSCVIVLSNAG